MTEVTQETVERPMQTVPDKYHAHISSKHKLFSLKLKEVWKYRDLIWLFTKRTFVLTYKQTILGPIWIFLTPLITALIQAFIFGGIAKIPTDGIPGILFYLTSTACWTYFAACVNNNASTFTANAGVFGKVYFPRLTVPISNMISSLVQFFVQFLLVLAFIAFFLILGQVSPDSSMLAGTSWSGPNWWAWLLVPFMLLHLGLLGLGVGIIVSSLTTKYRDLSVLVTFGVSLWMYITPIVYPISATGGAMKTILQINPVTPPIEALRWALLGKGTIDPLMYGISVGITILVLIFGIMIFNKVERTFTDTV